MRDVVVMVALVVGCIHFSACGAGVNAESDSALDVPVDMHRGASPIAIHRPLKAGMRLHVQGVMRKHRRITGVANGVVVNQQTNHLQLSYDLNKTLLDVDASGNVKRVRYQVGFVESTDAEAPPFAALSQGQVARLQGASAAQTSSSSGQIFDFERVGDQPKVAMVSGTLTPVERVALTDPFGPGYELWFEGELAQLFGPKEPQREGGEWDIDVERARQLLVLAGELSPPMTISGKATFVGLEKVGDVKVQRVEAWVKGEGGLHIEEQRKIHANINRVEVKYVGLFPLDASLPPVEHDWQFKAKGHVVMEISDVLGDLQFESRLEHQSRILEVHR
ncbi:MAG TPA: hypothetical protein VEX18_17575 [Polyangiaceae bacterium]|nr:hypothetical protein [Polyangiaceae bacterium]